MEQTAELLFRRALEAAAKALRDLKAGQVPADLRRVAGRPLPLPPPLAASLLKAIDRYDWLREKAVEAWPEADPKSPGPDQASALLLLRPPGWTAGVAALAAAAGAGEARSAAGELREGLREARAEAVEWKRRARAAEQEARREAHEASRLLAQERAAREALEVAPLREESARQEELKRLAAEAEQRAGERDEERRKNRRLKQAAAEARRARAAAEARLAEVGGAESWSGDVLGLATHLDRTAVMARPPASRPVFPDAEHGARLRLPGRILPDRKEAIDWVVRRTGAATLIVDGYNVAFVLTGSGEPGPGREAVLMVLDRLRRVARGPLRVVAAFDSRLEPCLREVRPGPIEVRFFTGEEGADRGIVELAGEVEGPRVVVSSDREVREASEAAGALALWSEALGEWWKRR